LQQQQQQLLLLLSEAGELRAAAASSNKSQETHLPISKIQATPFTSECRFLWTISSPKCCCCGCFSMDIRHFLFLCFLCLFLLFVCLFACV
jgi:hypothetical protein